jgi:hypothetical protein
MYRDCYDEGHKIIMVSRLGRKATRRQKGIYDSFICEECEGETQKYDHYASLVLTARSPQVDEYISVKREYVCKKYEGKKLEFAKWEGLDFRRFQNFVFSIILRSHFAAGLGGPLSLSQKHLDGILAIYKGSQPDDASYPILLLEYPRSDELRNHVVLLYMIKKAGHYIIEFAGGGYAFNVYVSSHAKPGYVRSLSVKSDGSTYFVIEPFRSTGLFKSSVQIVKSLEGFPRLNQ